MRSVIDGPGVVIWPLRSGSSGNCLLLGAGGAVVLVDAGWRAQRDFVNGLAATGVAPERVVGILVTHTHSDHVNYTTYRFAERFAVPLFMHTRNWERAYRLHYRGRRAGDPPWRGERRLFRHGEPFPVAGSFEVESLEVPHDGGTCSSFLVACRGCGPDGDDYRISVATDLGAWGARTARLMARAHFHVVEANWDPQMIEASPRSAADVARVRSNRGHLANEDAGRLVAEAARLRGRPPHGVMLAHLSDDHNTMARALGTVRRVLARHGLGSVPVTAAPRGRMAEPVVVDPRASRARPC
jgi:phosphoribosyl 1,2-cyclic phosphodiesterase